MNIMTQWNELIEKNDKYHTQKLLDYFDGDQIQHVEKVLNDPQKGRHRWREKGIIPRSRNLTKTIVEKSGLLFDDNPPMLEVYSPNQTINKPASEKVTQIFDQSDWVENWISIDAAVRLLKTVIVLIHKTDNDLVVFDVLHQGNSTVITDPKTHEIVTLAYRVRPYSKTENGLIRVITADLVDLYEYDSQTKTEKLIDSQPNPLGIIPCVVVHDTNAPRTGVWNKPGCDLVQLNEMYNLHLTDSEYAASWSKMKTLFTNSQAQSTVENDILQVVQPIDSPLPTLAPSSREIVGGPGTTVHITPTIGQTPYVEYLGPEVNLLPIDEMFRGWIRDFASDWSVNVKDGNGTANSGFQLVVEEIDNLQLRKRRQKMFTSSFRRLYSVIAAMFNLPIDNQLFISFSEPKLPVDPMEDEQVWTERLKNGRASIIDYLMEKYQLTHDEAQARLRQIQRDQQMITIDQQNVIEDNRASDINSANVTG